MSFAFFNAPTDLLDYFLLWILPLAAAASALYEGSDEIQGKKQENPQAGGIYCRL